MEEKINEKKYILSAAVLAVIATVVTIGATQDNLTDDLKHIGSMFQEAYMQPSDILASYGEQEITASMVAYRQELAVMTYSSDGTIHTERPETQEVIDQILVGMILVDEAEEMGVAATREEVQECLETQKSLAADYPEAAEQLQAYWDGAGMTEEVYWKLVEESLYQQLSIANLKSALMGQYEAEGVSGEEALAAYDAYKADLLVQHQEEITYYSDLKR